MTNIRSMAEHRDRNRDEQEQRRRAAEALRLAAVEVRKLEEFSARSRTP